MQHYRILKGKREKFVKLDFCRCFYLKREVAVTTQPKGDVKMRTAFMITAIISSVFTMLLVGCGGGGGGGGDGRITSSIEFIKWSAIEPPETVYFTDGISQEATYTATSITEGAVSTTSTTSIEYRADGTIERIAISTPFTSVIWDETSGDLIDESEGVMMAYNQAETTLFAGIDARDPAIPFEYQTFGVWLSSLGQDSGIAGVLSIGAPTMGNAIPNTTNVTFTGATTGFYADATDRTYATFSPLTMKVDFLNRTLDLTTTGTEKIDLDTEVSSAAANLDMTGTLTYAAGTNSFAGNVVATGLSGSSTGQFYGPNAEELGGVFSLSGGEEHYMGGYGAQR